MRRIQIDLPADVHRAITEMAAQHGHRLKPFIEFIISVQAGHVPPPQVRPVKFTAEKVTAEKVKPAQTAPEQVKPAQGMRTDVAALAHLLKPSTQVDTAQAARRGAEIDGNADGARNWGG